MQTLNTRKMVCPHNGQNGHCEKNTTNKFWRSCEEKEISYAVGGKFGEATVENNMEVP